MTTFFPPQNSIASLRPYSWAKYWTLEGHEVDVLTIEKENDSHVDLTLPNPGYNLYEVKAPELLKRMRKSYQSNPKDQVLKHTNKGILKSLRSKVKKYIFDLFHYLRYKKGIFNACRMPDFMDLWIRPAWKMIRTKGRWDVVVSTAGPYAVHIVAERLKRKGLADKWIADYRDTWSNNYIYPGVFPFNFIERILERKLLRAADVISTISQPFAEAFSARYGHKACVIENGFDLSDMETLPEKAIFPDDGKIRIVHTGSIYLGKRDPTPLFQAIKELSLDLSKESMLDRLEVLFVGPRQANLEELIKVHQVSKWVKTLGFIKREDALRMQRDADLLLFLPWNDLTVDGVLTGKIFEYLFSGTPIIAVGSNGLEASQKLILDAKAGYATTNIDDIKKILISTLTENKKSKNELDPNFLDHYNRKTLAIKLLKKITSASN